MPAFRPMVIALLFLAAFAAHATTPKATLKPFASEAELQALLKTWVEQQQRRRAERRADAMQAAPASAAAAESITNVQHAGVEEGGIVKLHGEHLVILRRGRLFTVEVRNLKPVATVDAYGPDIDPRGAWYDEMLIWQDTVVVIGYSYARGGTEVALFDLSAAGELRYRSTYHLRSNDYYSSRNYASRLIGSKLVFYTPLYLNPWATPLTGFPAMRKWGEGEFKRITPATRIYRTDEPLDAYQGLALHSVSICDLAQRSLACEGSAVLGPAGRVFYVSPSSVFVWAANSSVFRIPLDGSAPSALKVSGTPIDQFSFLEGDDGHLNVLVRAHGRGEAMWSSEAPAGQLALPHAMPDPRAFAVRYARPEVAHEVPLAHGIDRIEALGKDAVLVGSDGKDLHFTSLRLGRAPSIAGRYTRPNASQGETRSHGFFYNAAEGLLGLPIIGRRKGASVLYVRNENLSFIEIGTLDSRAAGTHDGCRASCVDWYGNSRPLFIRGRVFALMGYELIEGELRGQRMHELRRIDFAPGVAFRAD